MFVSNVLNGMVTRIDLSIPKSGNPIVESQTQIASGYLTRIVPAVLAVGPTGLAYDAKNDTLYVASTGDNEIFAIPNAGTRTNDAGTGNLVYQDNAHLRGPLGLVLAPNGDLITANGDAVNPDPNQPSELVEFTPQGKFVGQFSIDPTQGGAFGLAVIERRRGPAPGRRRGRHQQPRCVDLQLEIQVLVRESQQLGKRLCRVGRELRHDHRHVVRRSCGERAVRGHRPTVQCHPGVGRCFDPVLPPARHVGSVIILSRRSAWAGRNSSLCFFRDQKSGHTRPGPSS